MFGFFKKKDESVWQAEPLEKYWAEGSTWRQQKTDYRHDVIAQKNAIKLALGLNIALGIVCVFMTIMVVVIGAIKLNMPLERVYFFDGSMIICQLHDDGRITQVVDQARLPATTTKEK